MRRKIVLLIPVAVIALALIAYGGSGAIGGTTTTTAVGLAGEKVIVEQQFAMTFYPYQLYSGFSCTDGSSATSPVEITTSYPDVCKGKLTDGNVIYKVRVDEVGTLSAGAWKFELFENGATKGAVYLMQGTAEAGTEGANLYWDLGSSTIPDGTYLYEVRVTKQA